MLQLIRPWRSGPDDSADAEQQEPHGTDEVVEAISLTSEEVHGGEEASCSVPESPNPAEGGSEPQDERELAGLEPAFAPELDLDGAGPEAEREEGQETEGEWIEFDFGDEECEEGEPGEPAEASKNNDEGAPLDEAPEQEEQGEPGSSRRDTGGERNQEQAFQIGLEELRLRRLQRAFATIISKVAEDAAGLPVEGDDEWDVQAIMERRLSHRPLWQCRMSREKERVVLVLDTSGSCHQQATFFQRLANLAIQLGDVEVYLAPNASLVSYWDKEAWQATLDGCNWPFRHRVVLFFGDFDGGDAVVEAARENKVYWFSCEGDRYQDMTEHDWCSYSLAEFRGVYYDCETDQDIIRLARRVRA